MDLELVERLERLGKEPITFLSEIFEALTKKQLEMHLSNPDIRPHVLDKTVEAWLFRIGRWGKMQIVWKDPENKIKKKVTQKEMIKRLIDKNLLRMFGQFGIKSPKINQCVLYRDYIGIDGKKYKEEFIITIDLKPELKKAIRGLW